ncbi:MAG TPA: DUF1552 domain-containing protein [Polyangia bacterium]|nr:DUF1552 domain-containing protein [Polyangia bacterium]
MMRGLLAGGGALTVPLPLLDIMLNGNGNAFAQGAALPKRYCTWFFGNGILPPRWIPAAVGTNWTLSEQLAPLAKVKDSLTVVTGLKRLLGGQPHQGGSSAATTGGPVEQESAVLPSIDQIVADAISQGTTYRSLEIGVSNATPNGPCNTLHTVSHRGLKAPLYPEFNPKTVFTRLFSAGGVPNPGNPDAAALTKLNQARKSVLDAVIADANELKTSLGTSDQQRLVQHLDGIRQLELRLQMMPPTITNTCTPPASPAVGQDAMSQAPSEVNAVQADMLAIAFACNMTKVATFTWTLPAAHAYFRQLGTEMNADFHDTICHTDPGDATTMPRYHKGVLHSMTSLAYFLEKMKSMTEGAGNVLDNSLVYVTSCTSWGKPHGADEWPVLLAGKAGGALKGNIHLRAPGENLSKVLFSIAKIMGSNVTTLGRDQGLVTTGLAGLTV